MNQQAPATRVSADKITLLDIFLTFFIMGLTAFGSALIAEARKKIVAGKGWLTEQEFLNGVALAQFLPGATMVTLTVFMGYRIKHSSWCDNLDRTIFIFF